MKNLGTLHVTMFNHCSVMRRHGNAEQTISDHDDTSRKMWLLLEYLLWNHKKPVSRDALLDLLWGEDETGNPINALKGLLFRVRNLLGAGGLGFEDPKRVLVYQNGNYIWDESIDIDLDTERFEEHCNTAFALSDHPESALPHILEALALYQGDFLPQNAANHWVTPLNVYYHSQFLKLCSAAINTLHQQARYREIIELCQRSIAIEPYDESLHSALIRALAASGSPVAAMQHYKYATELFMNQFGVSPSEEMTALYQEINTAMKGVETDLQSVRNDLQESNVVREPYFCGYATFKEIYHLSARAAVRSGDVVQLVMLTLQSVSGIPLTQKQIRNAMKNLHNTIASTLRMGDVITQYSPTQYLIMLPSASYENAQKVVARLMRRFLPSASRVSYSIDYSLLPLLPIMRQDPEGFTAPKA